MTQAMMKPIDNYDPAWIEWNLQHPHSFKAVGADVSPGAGDDGGEASASDADAGDGDATEGAGSDNDTPSRTGFLGQDKPADGDGQANGDDKTGQDKTAQRPDDIPEKFWNAESGEVRTDSLMKAYNSLEKAHTQLKESKGGKAPKEHTEYFTDGFEMPEGVENIPGITGDDPFLDSAAKAAHAAGLSKDQMNMFVSEYLRNADEHVPTPIDPEAEIEKLGEGGKDLVNGLQAWADNLEAKKEITPAMLDRIYKYAGDAEGIMLLNYFRNQLSDAPIPVQANVDGEQHTRDSWRQMMRDERYGKDMTFTEKVDKIGDRVNGTQPSGSSRI